MSESLPHWKERQIIRLDNNLFGMRLAYVALFFCGAFLAVADDAPLSIVGSPGDLRYADLIKATRKYDTVFVWEGTPRQKASKSVTPDSDTEKTFKIGDQNFYSLPLGLTDQETVAVSDAVLKHIENFNPWTGPKFCGGFHANYAIEWREKGVTVAQALLCFTCGEARFLVGNRMEVVDQSDEGSVRFRALLWSHHHEVITIPGDVLNPPKLAVPKIDESTPPPR
jgi:hypothetical protein